MGNMNCKNRGFWVSLEAVLYSLYLEIVIIFLIIIDTLCITTEILLDYGILQVTQPNAQQQLPRLTNGDSNHSNVTELPNRTSETRSADDQQNGPLDPGGTEDIRVVITYYVTHYVSVAIAALFLFEISLKALTRGKLCCRDKFQVFDAGIVVVLLALEVTFTVVPLSSHLPGIATYIVLLRLWRIPRVCNIRAEEYIRRMEAEMYELRSSLRKSEENNKILQHKLDRHDRDIKRLESMLVRYEKDYKIDKNQNNTEPSTPDTAERRRPTFSQFAEDVSTAILKNASAEVAQKLGMPKNVLKRLPNGNVPNRPGIPDFYIPGNSTDGTSPEHKGMEPEMSYPILDSREVFIRVDSESSASLDDLTGVEHQVTVEVEDTEHSKNYVTLASVESAERIIRSNGGYVNESFDDAFDPDMDWQIVAEFDGTKTYRSSEGIPMTSL